MALNAALSCLEFQRKRLAPRVTEHYSRASSKKMTVWTSLLSFIFKNHLGVSLVIFRWSVSIERKLRSCNGPVLKNSVEYTLLK